MSEIDELFDSGELSYIAEPDPDLVGAPIEEEDGPAPVDSAPPTEPATRTRRPSTRAKGGRTRKSKSDSLAEITQALQTEAYKLGGMIAPLLPTTGGYMISESDDAMRGIVNLAQDNPKALEALKMVAKAAPGFTVGKFLMGAATCVMVDTRRIAPDTVPARMLGVTRIWVATHEKEAADRGVYVADPVPVEAFAVL